MAEQRLIDANTFAEAWNQDIQIGKTMRAVIAEQPTIDPETLPIVRQLREELERVKKDRDAVAKDVKRIVRRLDNGEELVQVCADFCANNNGACVMHAELGRFDECKGFAYRGPQKEE